MATADETNTSALPQFSSIKPFEQLAVRLRAEGRTYDEIVNMVNTEFDLAYKNGGVREWFGPGGRLEQAYWEYLEFMADESVKEAKLKIKQISLKAATKLETLMDDKNTADNIVERAARTVLNKYIPDRQVIIDENKAESLPSAIGDAGDAALTETPGDQNGQNEVANASQGETPSPNPGA